MPGSVRTAFESTTNVECEFMKLYYTRNEVAEILGVSPQTVSNYVKRGLLVESETKDPCQKSMCILGSSVECLLNESYDLIKQSDAVELMREELDELWSKYTRERDELDKLHKLLKISYGFHNNIEIISEILAAYLIEMNVLTQKELWLITEMLSSRSFRYIVDNSDLTKSDISTIYYRALKKLTTGRKPKYNEVLVENDKLRELLEIEREKSSKLEKQLNVLENRQVSSEETITIPNELIGINPDKISVRLYNALRTNGIEHLYELALIKKDILYGTRNFGRKCVSEVIDIMTAYNLEFDNIESLKNLKISFVKGLYIDVPIILLEQRNRELCNVKTIHYGI